MAEENAPEPWLRGTLRDVAAVPRAVLHVFELAEEDVDRWCGPLTLEQWNARPAGLPPCAFHLRHMARSIDRLLTYAEGRQLSDIQLAQLRTEMSPGAVPGDLLAEFRTAISTAAERVRVLDPSRLEEPRAVGRKQLPTSVGGLLVHVADHTQRHLGQLVTTAKLVVRGNLPQR